MVLNSLLFIGDLLGALQMTFQVTREGRRQGTLLCSLIWQEAYHHLNISTLVAVEACLPGQESVLLPLTLQLVISSQYLLDPCPCLNLEAHFFVSCAS